MEAEQEAEAQRQAEVEAEQEAEAQRQAEMEAEQEAEVQRQAEMEAEQEAEAQRQAEQRAALEADVQAQADALNKEYIDLLDRKQAAFENAVDANNVEERDRLVEEQYELGKQMEQVRSRIIENNNRLK